jgi:hypothetical protein
MCLDALQSESTHSFFRDKYLFSSKYLSYKRSKCFHNCSLTRAGKLPQRPAQRRIISQALIFTLAYSKQIQTAWSFAKRSIFIKNTPRFFGRLEFDCPATLNI